MSSAGRMVGTMASTYTFNAFVLAILSGSLRESRRLEAHIRSIGREGRLGDLREGREGGGVGVLRKGQVRTVADRQYRRHDEEGRKRTRRP
jgi:hypothetical protein